MARMHRKTALAIGMLMALSGTATAGQYPERMGKIHMNAVVNLPAPGSLTVVDRGGELVIMSGNGRYLVRGAIYDMWNGGRRIRTLKEARESARHIRFDQMNFNVDELSTITVGDPKGKRVVVFVDSASDNSSRLLKQIAAIKTGYEFKVVVLGVMGTESARKAKGLMCLAAKDMDKAKDVVLSGDFHFVRDGECGKERLLKALVSAMLFGIDKLPFTVAPNGEVMIGNPPDLKAFLEANKA